MVVSYPTYRYGLSASYSAEDEDAGAKALSLRLTCRFPFSVRILICALAGWIEERGR